MKKDKLIKLTEIAALVLLISSSKYILKAALKLLDKTAHFLLNKVDLISTDNF